MARNDRRVKRRMNRNVGYERDRDSFCCVYVPRGCSGVGVLGGALCIADINPLFHHR